MGILAFPHCFTLGEYVFIYFSVKPELRGLDGRRNGYEKL